MTDRFKTRGASLEGPATDGFAIVPNDITELSEITRAIYVGAPGNITLVLASGVELLFENVASGAILPVRARLIKSTGTTASNMLGLV